MATSSKSVAKAKETKAPAKKVAAKKAPAKKATVKKEITEEMIRQRAIEIYIESGCVQGRDKENWLQAESELSAKK